MANLLTESCCGASGLILDLLYETASNHIKSQSRLLTPGEMSMVTSVFKSAIVLSQVRVRDGILLPHQGKYAITPFGGIYWPHEYYSRDYSIEPIRRKHFFMHEMTHVWQYQMGMQVALRGAFSLIANYEYGLKEGKLLSNYGMEQQASIIADYYALKNYGFNVWKEITNEEFKDSYPKSIQLVQKYWLKMYEDNLCLFLKNPKDKKAIFG
ncbi:hypothetical protein J3U75_03285 [Snodgrassella sp. B3088]|uniref:hypothetical protein n=1 Tax=Snodgrassella sp. B3088 TaxID=2818038 RepID=UPI00226A2E76|nr:hypothetical protein [Snodgrassella sp. B3088]MCX8748408.1 hypothetical protein [Snodgrassella sp. B3088]